MKRRKRINKKDRKNFRKQRANKIQRQKQK